MRARKHAPSAAFGACRCCAVASHANTARWFVAFLCALAPPSHPFATRRTYAPTTTPTAAAPRPAPRARAVSVRAADAAAANGGANGGFAFAEGARVKVVAPVRVYHVPKHPEVALEGLEGTVKKIAALHKGAVLSANLQYRVQFEAQLDGAAVKFFAHLVRAVALHSVVRLYVLLCVVVWSCVLYGVVCCCVVCAVCVCFLCEMRIWCALERATPLFLLCRRPSDAHAST